MVEVGELGGGGGGVGGFLAEELAKTDLGVVAVGGGRGQTRAREAGVGRAKKAAFGAEVQRRGITPSAGSARRELFEMAGRCHVWTM